MKTTHVYIHYVALNSKTYEKYSSNLALYTRFIIKLYHHSVLLSAHRYFSSFSSFPGTTNPPGV
ncbi:hypothetical protein E2C01_034168 [Portunus trituberculatus]|uniref:Uncharacterized protein n=1 Tax=Portunus trituberculatus TaxID=210409 RepID=A0A5B7F5F2_PORTR|nr:hypothetical protein [Portunus trituberculatus]